MKMKDFAVLVILTLCVSLPGLASLTVVDRDESRYAQATMQMLETGDYIDIRFQEQPRWKKPAGSYWAQAASVKAARALGLTTPQERAIWMHRLPSVLAAILAVLATYYSGAKLIGRDAGYFGAMMLAVSVSMVFEAHIAKTDALLTAFTAVCLAALCALRAGGGRGAAIVFWASMGVAVMMKGPITPVIIASCLVSLAIWERGAAWMKPLRSPIGILIFIALIAPWTYLIWEKTGGDFFKTAVGEDLGSKLSGQSENHGGPPGYYLATVWAMFWPGTAFLIAGIAMALRAVFRAGRPDAKLSGAARLLLCFALPWWIIVEITPTKLTHYTLPIYPALALMAGGAAAHIAGAGGYKMTRRIGAGVFAFIGILLTAALLYGQGLYGIAPTWEYAVGGIIIAAILSGSILLWKMPARQALRKAAIFVIIGSGAALGMLSFGRVLPAATDLTVSENVAGVLSAAGYDLPLNYDIDVLSPNYSEPSLVYYLGTHIQIGGDANYQGVINPGTILIVDRLHKKSKPVFTRVEAADCFETLGTVRGLNYSKGDEVVLVVMRAKNCAS